MKTNLSNGSNGRVRLDKPKPGRLESLKVQPWVGNSFGPGDSLYRHQSHIGTRMARPHLYTTDRIQELSSSNCRRFFLENWVKTQRVSLTFFQNSFFSDHLYFETAQPPSKIFGKYMKKCEKVCQNMQSINISMRQNSEIL